MTSDLLATYLCYCTTRSLSFSSRQTLLTFLRRKLLLVVHHSVLILGYPLFAVSTHTLVVWCWLNSLLCQYDGLRKGLGDFLIGTMLVREMSSPFVAAAKVMKRVSTEVTIATCTQFFLFSLDWFSRHSSVPNQWSCPCVCVLPCTYCQHTPHPHLLLRPTSRLELFQDPLFHESYMPCNGGS